MKYLVTGGAGFIGSNIVKDLVEAGETVRVIDNLSTGHMHNIAKYLDKIELFTEDIRNYDAVAAAVDGMDFVLHQGALASVPRSIEDPISCHEVNETGILNLLDASAKAGVKRFIMASSSSVYGDNPTLPKTEDMVPVPKSPYAVSKLTGEHYCRVFHEVYGLETVALRYFNVFGPNQDPTSQYSAVIPKFINSIMKDESPIIYGDGLQSRDFTYVVNNVSANLLACRAEKVAGGRFNIACGGRYTLLELVEAINLVLNKNIEPIFDATRAGDVKHSHADIGAAMEQLKYTVDIDFHEGLNRTIDYYLQLAS